MTESVLQFVRNMRGDLLGSIGLAFLVYTVVTTIQKVETSFNSLWRVDRPRSFLRRFIAVSNPTFKIRRHSISEYAIVSTALRFGASPLTPCGCP